MKVEQVYELVNGVVGEITGKTDLLKEDLSNVVDVGKEIFDTTNVDNYVKTLMNHIAKVKFVGRVYSGNSPSVLMDSWEYAAVVQKIQVEIPEAEQNDSWELEDRKSYDPNIFYQPKVSVKFFNSYTTFDVPMSFADMQAKESFSNAMQLNGFLSMIQVSIENGMTIAVDALVKATINSMIADTLTHEFPGGIEATSTGTKAVNLMQLYKDQVDSTFNLSPSKAMKNPEFIRFCVYVMGLYVSRLSSASTLFNMGGKVRFTTAEYLHVIMLNDFKSAANVYLQSDTYNKEFTALPESETVPFWQASGVDYEFESTSKINVTSGSGNSIETDGILAVMFDREALGVNNSNRRVTSNYNPKAEFYSNFYKVDAGYFNDGNENFIVFFVK